MTNRDLINQYLTVQMRDGFPASVVRGKENVLYFYIVNAKNIGGKEFEFFSPIFNIADASISVGVIALLLFQKRLVRRDHSEDHHQTVTTNTELSDQAHVM